MPQFDPTALRLAVTFGAMGVWVVAIALATARWGEKVGGFLIGIPSTAGLSFFFTGLFVSSAVAVRATDDFPVFMSLACVFLLVFGYLAKRNFATGIGGALLVWLALSLLVVYSGLDDFGLSLAASLVVFAATYYLFRRHLRPRMSGGGGAPKRSVPLTLLRFALGGGIVSLAVFFGQVGVPVLSALAASFPALSISALLAVRMDNRDEGTGHARGLTMSSAVSIMVMLIPFSVAVHYL